MASVFLYHVVGDLTVGKPELVEFLETETVEASIKAIGESMEGGIPVWRRPRLGQGVSGIAQVVSGMEKVVESRQQRFVGILNSLDIVAFLAREESLKDQEKAMKTPVSQVVVPNSSLLKEVDPATRLIDALELMKQGVRRLLVPKGIAWKGMSKRFSVLYNGKWLKNPEPPNFNRLATASTSSPPPIAAKFCCLSREDMIRFLIGSLGALAPLPLSSLSSLGAVNPNYLSIDASIPALEITSRPQQDPEAFGVIETLPGGRRHRIIGEISACGLWKCDHTAASWALANLSAGQFVTGVEDNGSLSDTNYSNTTRDVSQEGNNRVRGARKFNSSRSMYRGRGTPLMCRASSSLAAVMAQMLSHRATHVWVTEADYENNYEDVVVGLVGYADILGAVTRSPAVAVSETVLQAATIFDTAKAK